MRVITGSAKGLKLHTPEGMNVRPTSDRVKEALFNIIGPYIEDALFVDAFAGTGNVGIEALSRGAKMCVFIEKIPRCVKIIKENLKKTGLDNKAKIYKGDVFFGLDLLKRDFNKVDYFFLDPPYKSELIPKVLDYINKREMLNYKGGVIIEHLQKNEIKIDNSWCIESCRNYGETSLSFLYKDYHINKSTEEGGKK